jgi:hypothetical protein
LITAGWDAGAGRGPVGVTWGLAEAMPPLAAIAAMAAALAAVINILRIGSSLP